MSLLCFLSSPATAYTRSLVAKTARATADEVIHVASTGRALKALLNLISLADWSLTSSISHHNLSGCSPSNNAVLSRLRQTLRGSLVKLNSAHFISLNLCLWCCLQGAAQAVGTQFIEHGGMAVTLKRSGNEEWATKPRQHMRQRYFLC